MGDFTHLTASGEAAMVDITDKTGSRREATVKGSVRVSAACAAKLDERTVREIATVARVAAIQAAKQTASLIPLCHQVALGACEATIVFDQAEQTFGIAVTAKTQSATGVEMEAFCAAVLAGTTIYDMIKAVDPSATVGPFRLTEKLGGKNGRWTP